MFIINKNNTMYRGNDIIKGEFINLKIKPNQVIEVSDEKGKILIKDFGKMFEEVDEKAFIKYEADASKARVIKADVLKEEIAEAEKSGMSIELFRKKGRKVEIENLGKIRKPADDINGESEEEKKERIASEREAKKQAEEEALAKKKAEEESEEIKKKSKKGK